MRSGNRTIFATAALAAFVAVGSARAIEPAPKPPEIGAPNTDITNGKGNLSEKLDRQNGVVHPQTMVDPGIAKEPPATGNTPVIKPPDAKSGEGDVQPK